MIYSSIFLKLCILAYSDGIVVDEGCNRQEETDVNERFRRL